MEVGHVMVKMLQKFYYLVKLIIVFGDNLNIIINVINGILYILIIKP